MGCEIWEQTPNRTDEFLMNWINVLKMGRTMLCAVKGMSALIKIRQVVFVVTETDFYCSKQSWTHLFLQRVLPGNWPQAGKAKPKRRKWKQINK